MPLPSEHSGETVLSWARQDIEQRLFFPGGRYTRVNTWLSALLAVIGMIAVYALLLSFPDSVISSKLVGDGPHKEPIPYAIVFLSLWCLSILVLKWKKLKFQRQTLDFRVTPETSDFILSAATVQEVINRIHQRVDDPKHFVLLNRILIALANLKNIGRVSDVD